MANPSPAELGDPQAAPDQVYRIGLIGESLPSRASVTNFHKILRKAAKPG
jgi:hypothetical protein